MKKTALLVILVLSVGLFAEWSVIETYPIPEGAAGLAWDGEFLYCGIYGANGDEFYQIDPQDGSFTLLFTNPQIGDAFGLTYDGENLWTTDHPSPSSNPAQAIQLDLSGNILSQFDLPDHYMSGIAYDNGDFWVATYYDPDGFIYKLDAQGNILNSFTAPDNQPWDLCLENGNLWMADYWGDALYKINPDTGELLETNPSEGVDPSGIVFDGNYIWYCDNGQGYAQDFLYKVEIGAPAAGFLEGFITDDATGEPIANIEINVDNLTTLSDAAGYYFIELPAGEHLVQINAELYVNYEETVVINADETTTLNINLQPMVYILPVEDLTVNEHGFLDFEGPDVHPMENYNIYLDGQLLENTIMHFYLLREMEVGQTYTVGVSVQYAIWESEIVTADCTLEYSHSYGDIDYNDDVSAYDASLILMYSVGIDPGQVAPLPWESWRKYCADVDLNYTYDAYDAALVLQYVVGLLDVFPGDNSLFR